MGQIRSGLTKLVVVFSLLAAAACGGGGGGGGGTTPTEPTQRITFTPGGQAGVQTLHLVSDSSASTATMLVLELRASEQQGLYGLAFDLTFPSNVLRFQSAQEGEFVSQGGTVSTSFQVVEEPLGNLVVGLSRLGDVSGRNGSGTVLRLTFTSTASGSGSFEFSGADVFDAGGRPVDGVSWFGGTVSVVR